MSSSLNSFSRIPTNITFTAYVQDSAFQGSIGPTDLHGFSLRPGDHSILVGVIVVARGTVVVHGKIRLKGHDLRTAPGPWKHRKPYGFDREDIYIANLRYPATN